MKEYKKHKKKYFQRVIFRLVDVFLTRNSVPFFGKISKRIRCFFARRISKGIEKGAAIEKGAIIFPRVFCEKGGGIGVNCQTCPGLHIGKNVMMGPNCKFYSTAHKRCTEGTKVFAGYEPPKEIFIEKDCWIGCNVVVMGGVKIGEGTTIGACSVVTHSVPSFVLAAGCPATIRKKYIPPKGYYDDRS